MAKSWLFFTSKYSASENILFILTNVNTVKADPIQKFILYLAVKSMYIKKSYINRWWNDIISVTSDWYQSIFSL